MFMKIDFVGIKGKLNIFRIFDMQVIDGLEQLSSRYVHFKPRSRFMVGAHSHLICMFHPLKTLKVDGKVVNTKNVI